MAITLPVDLLHLVAEQLANRADYPTLCHCVLSSKHFASSGAVSALYRISHDSPLKGGGNEADPLAVQGQNVQKWSILWRTIILSALGRTVYPYCRHLRMLDLRDLSHLLEDDKFRGKVSKEFFAAPLARFHFQIQSTIKGRAPRLDIKSIIAAIGDEITQQAPLLESIVEPATTNLFTNSLLTWAPRLNHLRFLAFWDGKALADESLRNVLHAHCPKLDHLTIYISTGEDSDHALAEFISGMPPNTLQYFENISDCGIGLETALALNSHGDSLTTLKLALTEEGVLALAKLQQCKHVEDLSISSLRPSVDLKATQNDVYLEIVEWLKNCTSLRELSFNNVVSAPDIITPILLDGIISLKNLDINAAKDDATYVVKDHHDFHNALSQQSKLEQLHLRADPEPTTRDDLEILMNTFCSLKGLRELKLTRISDYFSDEHISLIAEHLPDLQELYVGGYGISDAVFSGVAGLKNLKAVTFSGLTMFTFEGVMDFIDNLGSGNQEFVMAVDQADPDSGLSQDEQDILRDRIYEKVEGRLEYQLLRDPNMPEFNSDDDSD